ncbi:MAG: TlpA family protein disulfide reductase [Anaerolineales bacterium]|nr:TlpA family protein disulfide reductase [Anaerolineales bacterium]
MTTPPKRFYTIMIGIGLISFGILLFIVLNKYSASAQDFSTVPVQVDFPAPDLTLQDISGNIVSLDDHLGSVVLVNFWATWCLPCTEEMPALQVFYEKYKENGFVLIAINQKESLETVMPFVKEFELTFPIWLDKDYQSQSEFHTVGLPSSYVIDRNGQVRLMWAGAISKKNLEKYVSDLIME